MVDPDWVFQAQRVMYIKHWTHISHIFTARKWSLGQGNVFASICHSFSTQGGGGVCIHGGLHPGHLHPRGVCIQGASASGGSASRASASKGGLHPGGICIGGSASRGVCIQRGSTFRGNRADLPPRYYGIWPTSGRYVSYWNAFLFRGKSYQPK